MMFSSIGTIHNSIKISALNMKWQERKNNPTKKENEYEDPQIAQLKKSAEDMRKGNIIASIDGKLKAGGTLTPDELSYLRENNPELYKEAVEIKKERDAYKKALKSCKTKEDVDKLNCQKLNQFLTECKVIRSNPNIPEGEKQKQMNKILKRVMGVKSEHVKFLKSKEYNELPREKEVKEKKKAQKKQKTETIEKQDSDLKDSKKVQDKLENEIFDTIENEDVKTDNFDSKNDADNDTQQGTKTYTSTGDVTAIAKSYSSEKNTFSMKI